MDYKLLQELYNSVPTKKEKSAIKDESAYFVMNRFNAMAIAKMNIRETWQGIQDLYYCNDWEWIVSGEDIIRPVRFPTLRDTIKSLVDNFIQNPPDWELVAQKEEDEQLVIGKKAYLDEWRESIHEKSVRRQVYEDMFFYGNGFRRAGWWDTDRYEGIATTRIDPRNVFIDETASKLHNKLQTQCARDIIIRNEMPLSSYYKFAKKYGFSDAVMPESYFVGLGLDYKVTNSQEITEKSPARVVRLYEYENPEENLYIVVANGKTVFKSTLEEARGTRRFSIAHYMFEPRNDSVWAIPIGQLLAPHIYQRDILMNLELLNLKYTLQPVIAVSGNFGYNPQIHLVQPGGVWQAGSDMNGKIQDNIQPIVTGNPNTRVYEALQNINSEMTVTSRTDLRSLQFYEAKTATEVNAQGRSMNAHNETIENINEVEAEAVLVENICEIMEHFMNDIDEDGNKKRVKIEGYSSVKNDTEKPEFIQASGVKDFFDLTKEMIDVPISVVIKDKRSLVAKNVEKVGRILQALPLIGNIAQLDPEVLKKIDIIGLVEQLLEAIGLDIEKSLIKEVGEYEDEFEAIKEEILLGNKVETPQEETRKESVGRLKFLLQMQIKFADKLDASQQSALEYQMKSTMDNIKRVHIKQEKPPMEQQVSAVSQPQGNIPQVGMQGTIAGQQPMGGTNIPTPAPVGGMGLQNNQPLV